MLTWSLRQLHYRSCGVIKVGDAPPCYAANTLRPSRQHDAATTPHIYKYRWHACCPAGTARTSKRPSSRPRHGDGVIGGVLTELQWLMAATVSQRLDNIRLTCGPECRPDQGGTTRPAVSSDRCSLGYGMTPRRIALAQHSYLQQRYSTICNAKLARNRSVQPQAAQAALTRPGGLPSTAAITADQADLAAPRSVQHGQSQLHCCANPTMNAPQRRWRPAEPRRWRY